MEDDLEIAIRHITDEAFKAVTPEEMASIFADRGAIITRTTPDGIVMRYVEPWERGDEA